MTQLDLDVCAAQLNEKVAAAVARVLANLELPDPVVTETMLADLGIAATGELAVEAPWTSGHFRVEAIENAAKPGTVVFQPAPLTAWAREVMALAGQLADEAEEEAEEAAEDAARD